MKIERKYHTKSVRDMNKIDEELQKLQESMTDEEKEKDKEENRCGFERLMEKVKKEQTRTRQVTNKTKKAYFYTMVLAGLVLAKVIEADFTAECDEECGKMCFITGIVFFDGLGGQSGRNELVLLIRMADHVAIFSRGNVIEWRFTFLFFDTFVG